MLKCGSKRKLWKIILGKEKYKRYEEEFSTRPVLGRIKCKDGTTLSVQASRTHYCTPKENFGPYTHVEVGYPSSPPPKTWDKYAHDDGGVYAYIPIELVKEYVELHGGEK